MTQVRVSRLSVLIVNYNSWRVCVDALRSLLAHRPVIRSGRSDAGAPLPLEVIVVDNKSPMRDPAAEAELRGILETCDGRLIMHDENGGYGKGMNLAYGQATGDAILICNPDLVFLPGCVDRLVTYLEDHPEAGAVAPEGFWDADLEGRLPPNILPTLGDLMVLFFASLSPRMVRRYSVKRTERALKVWTATADLELQMLSGCCFLMRRATIEEIGLFDERFPLYYEDTDLSIRLRKAGYKIVQVHGARLVHLYNRSGQTDNELALRRYFISRRLHYRKWYGVLGGLLYAVTRRIQGTAWATRRAALFPQRNIIELGAHKGPPVIEFERDYGRILVEVALDPYFYLAAAIFAAGRRWTIGAELFHSFGPMTYYFRVLNLSAAQPLLIGVYRYTRIPWDAPNTVPAAEEAQLG